MRKRIFEMKFFPEHLAHKHFSFSFLILNLEILK